MAVDKLVDSAQLNADLTSVANAIRTKGGTSAQMAFPAGFVSAVEAIPSGGGTGTIEINTNGTYDVSNYATAEVEVEEPDGWARPEKYPDYDTKNLTGFEGVYLTYDLSLADEWAQYISINAIGNAAKQSTVDRGHFDSSGNFVVEDTYTTTSYHFTQKLDPNDGEVQIWRAHCDETYVGTFSFIDFEQLSNSRRCQPCVEVYETLRSARIADCPYSVKSVTFNGCYQDNDMYAALNYGYGLEQCIFKNATQKITDTRSMVGKCYSLKKIEFDRVSMVLGISAFGYCVSMKTFKLPPATLESNSNANQLFAYMYAAKELDLRNLVVTSDVTSMNNNIFIDDNNLETLNMDGVRFEALTSAVNYTLPMLKNLYPPMIPTSQTWNCPNLSKASLLRLINVLPTAESARTLTIGAINTSKLTAEEIAVATAKGWTVA